MTPAERRARAERFLQWMENDGLGAGLNEIRSAYIERIAALDPTDRGFADKARVLSIGAKVVDQVIAQLKAVVGDGAVAADEIARMEKLKGMSAEKRRWL